MGNKIINGNLKVTGTLTNNSDVEYEITSNKVTSLTVSSTNTQYPSAKAVYDAVENVRELAEGKCKAMVLDYSLTIAGLKQYGASYLGGFSIWNSSTEEFEDKKTELFNGDYDNATVQNSYFNSSDNYVNLPSAGPLDEIYLLFGNFTAGAYIKAVKRNDLNTFFKNGDTIYVIQVDVPDRWYGSGSYYKLETALSGYLKNDMSLIPATTNTYDIGSSSYAWKDLYLSGSIYAINELTFIVDNTSLYIMNSTNLRPTTAGNKNLGSSYYKWKDLYLAGKLYGATYNIDIDDLYSFTYNVSYSANTTIQLGVMNIFSKSADTTLTLASAPANTYPEYKAIITNSNVTAITITLPSGTVILTNDDVNVVVNGNTFSLSGGHTCELNIMNLNCVVIIF